MDLIDDQSLPALARGVRLQTDATTGEPVLLFPEGVICLSPTAQAILTRCNGHTSAADIIADLGGEYAADAETLRRDVWDCLGDLLQRKVVVLAK
jgi:coenzyme PQQ biosynthesis protein PqqD